MRIATLLAILLIVISAASLTSGPRNINVARAAGTPTLQVVSPGYASNITSITSLGVGQKFRVDVNVTNLGPITGFDITLNYAMSYQLQTPIQTDRTQVSLSPGLFDGTGLPSGCSVLEASKQVYGDPIDSIRLAEVFQGGCNVQGDGRLFSANFTVTGIDSTSLDILRATGGHLTQMITGPSPGFGPIPGLQVVNGYFRNKPGIPPNPSFTFSPTNPKIGTTVAFNGTQTVDPDNPGGPDHGIQRYIWAWGDLSPASGGNTTDESHQFLLSGSTPGAGYFQVRLVVIDADDGIANRTSALIFIDPGIVHDIASQIATDKTVVNVGDSIQVTVTVFNKGNQNENAKLNVTYDSQGTTVLAQESSVPLPQTNRTKIFQYTMQTANLAPRVYTISALARPGNSSIVDSNPLNDLSTVQVTVNSVNTGNLLPLPVLVGSVGGVIVVVAALAYIMRRRRKSRESAEDRLA